MYTPQGTMIRETQQVMYVAKINGVPVTLPQPSRHLAEAALSQLPAESRQFAVIVPVTTDGKELLFEAS